MEKKQTLNEFIDRLQKDKTFDLESKVSSLDVPDYVKQDYKDNPQNNELIYKLLQQKSEDEAREWAQIALVTAGHVPQYETLLDLFSEREIYRKYNLETSDDEDEEEEADEEEQEKKSTRLKFVKKIATAALSIAGGYIATRFFKGIQQDLSQSELEFVGISEMDMPEEWESTLDTILSDTFKVTSEFGLRDIESLNRYGQFHKGMDFGTPVGTPVYAPFNGKVVRVGEGTGGAGQRVAIKNGDFEAMFLHLSEFAVEQGDEVEAGDLVAYTGNTGIGTGAHLDYRVSWKGKYVNPRAIFTDENGDPVDMKLVAEYFNDQIQEARDEIEAEMAEIDTSRSSALAQDHNNITGMTYSKKNPWEGQTGNSGRFASFSDPFYSLRATMKVAQKYKEAYEIDTVEDFFNKYAPPHENKTKQYAAYVAKHLGVAVDEKIDLTDADTLIPMVQAIAMMESSTAVPTEALQEVYDYTFSKERKPKG